MGISAAEIKPKVEYVQPPVKLVIIWIITIGIMAARTSLNEAAAVSADSVPRGG